MQAYYCNICEALLLNLDGLFCDSCGVCADRSCIKLADKQLKCKAINVFVNSDQPMKHHWVKGVTNLYNRYTYFHNRYTN